MDSFYHLLKNYSDYITTRQHIVGNVSEEQLEILYELIAKATAIISNENLTDNLVLSGYAEGKTKINEYDNNQKYRGAYTIIHYSEGTFTFDRIDSEIGNENSMYFEGRINIEIKSNNLESLMNFVANLSRIANIQIVIPSGKDNKFDYSVFIYKKGLKDISEAESIKFKNNEVINL